MGKRPKGVNKDGYRQIAARFDGECSWCGKKWPKGKQIWWHVQWQVAVCCPQHQIAKHMETYASRRRRMVADSPTMEPQGGLEH